MNRPLWSYEELDKRTILNLKASGFNTVADVKSNIENAQKICVNIQDVIFNEKKKCVWQSGHDVLKKESKRVCITTFSKYLDELLNGGIELGKLTEINGASGSGKTQLCLQLVINTTLPKMLTGLEAESVYIETTKSVFPSRLNQMMEAYLNHVRDNFQINDKLQCMRENKMKSNAQSTNFKIVETCNGPVDNKKQKNSLLIEAKAAIAASSQYPKVVEDIKKEETSAELKERLCKGSEICRDSNSTEQELIIPIGRNKIKLSKTDLDTIMNPPKRAPKESFQTQIKREFLSSIHVHYCSDYHEILALILNIEDRLTDPKANIKLLVIDNITFLFHNEEDSNYLKRTKDIYFLLNMLSDLAVTYNIAIVIVNQLTTKYLSLNQRKVVPALGETFAHRIQTRLFLQKLNLGLLRTVQQDSNRSLNYQLDDDTLFMCLIDKMILKREELKNKKHVVFRINSHGVRDV